MARPPLPDDPDPRSDRPPSGSRRRFLQVGSASALGLALSACRGDATGDAGSARPGSTGTGTGSPTTATSLTAASLTAADFEGLATCTLLPEMTAGPFPLDEQFDRRDITEGADGRPMRLGLRIVDDACTAIGGARVEIWHCDATGDYSAFSDGGGGKDAGAGTTFLRGTQTAGDDGIAEFATIVPGWYPGRAVHIHVRVHLEGTTVLTSQLFFDADHLAEVYASAPYAELGLPDTSNDADGIAGDVGRNGTLLVTTAAPTELGPATLALLNLGIDPTSSSGAADGARPR